MCSFKNPLPRKFLGSSPQSYMVEICALNQWYTQKGGIWEVRIGKIKHVGKMEIWSKGRVLFVCTTLGDECLSSSAYFYIW